MSWLPEKRVPYTWWQSICLRIIRCGELPKHVAFIMDGNRRFAREKNLQKIEGHIHGFEKLAETLQWCNDLGINQVTVYAFSIENYKRPSEEVDSLLNLARDKFRRLIKEADRFAKEGVRVNVIGNLSLLPSDLQALIFQAMEVTSKNEKATLNVAFSYTSRDEMTHAVKVLANAVDTGYLEVEDINVDLIERCFYTSLSNKTENAAMSACPDLLVRTSGESRLSDFLLWQSSYSVTHFTEVLWPDFGLHHLMGAIFHYQSKNYYISEILSKSNSVNGNTTSNLENDLEETARSKRISRFLELLESSKFSASRKSECTQNDATIMSVINNIQDNKGL